MTTGYITVEHNDATGEVTAYVTGEGRAREIADHIMSQHAQEQGDRLLSVEEFNVS